jgi:teichuronic acid biosynthesis glycosyltransferase TuaH
MGPGSDAALRLQVRRAARSLGLTSPTLWVNDLSHAGLVSATGWPTLYDITDDWLVEQSVPERVRRRRRRLEERLLRDAAEVVVCSPGLAESRGRSRPVTLIPNGVDVEHVTRPQPRPEDLGPSPVAVYVGTLHDERFDVELLLDLAERLPDLTVTLVGPDALAEPSRAALAALPNVRLLGPRPYDAVPGYLQHADVIVIPHRINEFTESLDPIKAYECLAVGRPTVATEVAGFRGLPHPVTIASRSDFAESVRSVLATGGPTLGALPADATWEARSLQFQEALRRSRHRMHPERHDGEDGHEPRA